MRNKPPFRSEITGFQDASNVAGGPGHALERAMVGQVIVDGQIPCGFHTGQASSIWIHVEQHKAGGFSLPNDPIQYKLGIEARLARGAEVECVQSGRSKRSRVNSPVTGAASEGDQVWFFIPFRKVRNAKNGVSGLTRFCKQHHLQPWVQLCTNANGGNPSKKKEQPNTELDAKALHCAVAMSCFSSSPMSTEYS